EGGADRWGERRRWRVLTLREGVRADADVRLGLLACGLPIERLLDRVEGDGLHAHRRGLHEDVDEPGRALAPAQLLRRIGPRVDDDDDDPLVLTSLASPAS